MGSAHTASLLLMELQLWTEDTFLKKATGLEESFRTDSSGCIKIWGGGAHLGSGRVKCSKSKTAECLRWFVLTAETHHNC